MSSQDLLQAHLEGYFRDGQHDSRGSFTLNEGKALQKLADFRLLAPELYVLNLVACAVAGKASQIEFSASTSELRFTSNAYLGPASEIEGLQAYALSTEAESAPRELAIAVQGALGLKPKSLEVLYWDGSQGRTWDPSQHPWAAGPLGLQHEGPLLTLSIKERFGLRTGRKLLARIAGALSLGSEQDVLHKHCNRCPASLAFNGTPLARRILLGKASQVKVFAPDGVLPSRHPLAELDRPVEASTIPLCMGVVGLGGQLPPWLTLIVCGVSFRLAGIEVKGHPVRGFVYADHLKKDLSQSQLVHDESLGQVIDGVKRLF